MRHRKKKGRLSRNISARKALMKIMANDLFTYQRIETTMAKAKALRSFAEPLITLAKKNRESVAARRQAYAKLCDRTVVKSLFDEIAPLYKDIAGGYTRIMAMGNRKGDGAPMAIMELTHRTISDDELLGTAPALEKKPSKKKAKGKTKDEDSKEDKKVKHAAPEVDAETKEEKVDEAAKKSKAKSEQKKVSEKGILKRFRRKSI